MREAGDLEDELGAARFNAKPLSPNPQVSEISTGGGLGVSGLNLGV